MTALVLFRPARRRVPLAWRNLLADRWRLARASAGIAFAVLLMLVQLGFERAFFDASLAVVRGLDGDLFVMNGSKYRFGTRNPLPVRDFETIRKLAGIETVNPLYADWMDFFWRSPIDDKPHLVRVFAVDPDAPPMFQLPEIASQQARLKGDATLLIDRKSRRFLGMDSGITEAKLDGEPMRVVGTFVLGPDFMSDGAVVMRSATFAKFFRVTSPVM